MIGREVHDGQSQVCEQVENVSAITFQGAGLKAVDDERHPMLSVTWKPDESKPRPNNLEHFLSAINTAGSIPIVDGANATLRRVAGRMDLFYHEHPRVRILEVGQRELHATKLLLGILQAESAFQRNGTYSRGYLSVKDEVMVEDVISAESLGEDLEKAEA